MVYYAHFDCLLCLWIKTGPTTQSSHEGACLIPQTNTVQLSVRDPHDSVSVCKQGVDHSPLVRFSKMQVGGGAVDIFDGRVVAVMGVWASGGTEDVLIVFWFSILLKFPLLLQHYSQNKYFKFFFLQLTQFQWRIQATGKMCFSDKDVWIKETCCKANVVNQKPITSIIEKLFYETYYCSWQYAFSLLAKHST